MSKEYSLSMSGSSARMQESLLAAREYLELGDWQATRAKLVDENLFQLNAVSSRKRVVAEIVKRLRTLTDGELEFFVSSYGDDRCAMLWVAICRTYRFVRDLSEEVIAERFGRTIPDFTQESYDVFFDEQAEIHPELERMTEGGRKKMRSTILRMLVECRLVDGGRKITQLHPTSAFRGALDSGHQEDLRIFPGGAQ